MTQEQDHSVIWSHEMQEEHVPNGVGEEDFTKFLDLDNDFNFGTLDNGHSGLDTPMARLVFDQNAMPSMAELGSYNNHDPRSLDMPTSDNSVGYSNSMPITNTFQQYQHYQQMQMQHGYQVPPTPVTSEMNPAKYPHRLNNAGHIAFDTRQISFTPLVSPAQTPLDNTFSMSEYNLADEFFSPLTSPAIEAQTNFSSSAMADSPVDVNLEGISDVKPSSSARNRGRRKGSMSLRAPARSVKQSPAMKAQTRRKQNSLSNISTEKIETTLSKSNSGQNLLSQPMANNLPGGSDDSVSPEPLTEALMRPPPVPQTSNRSPLGHVESQSTSSTMPATPATLMKMPSNQAAAVKTLTRTRSLQNEDQMDEHILPDAAQATILPALADTDAGHPMSGEHATENPFTKSAKISAASTPRSTLTKIASSESFTKPAKVEGRGGRASKKRQSTSSATISPALRPKISPSISPLVPATGPGLPHLSAETSALYLASKSNYQNILEGTHLPGVSYPEALAENLSSKRTSHKIAEQGRRNRINLALKEIEGLLPASITAANNKKEKAAQNDPEDGDKSGASAQGASKASTVEMAIAYIKGLQAELQMTKDKLDAAEKKLAEGNSSAGSQTSE